MNVWEMRYDMWLLFVARAKQWETDQQKSRMGGR